MKSLKCGFLKDFSSIINPFPDDQVQTVTELKTWLEAVSHVDVPAHRRRHFQQFKPSDVFIGYHDDAPASIVLRLSKEAEASKENVLQKAKSLFLECATPDAISRLSETRLSPEEKARLSNVYFDLHKSSLAEAIEDLSPNHPLLQVTTFSRLLTDGSKRDICRELDRHLEDVQLITLQQINTEEQFTDKVRSFLEFCQSSSTEKVLIVQGQVNPDTPHSLVECARYSIMNQVQKHKDLERFCIILVLQVPRICGGFFSGFPGNQWKALHIDELCGDPNNMSWTDWTGQTLHQALSTDEDMDFKQLLLESLPRAATMSYKSDDLSSQRIVHCIETIRQRLADQVCHLFLKSS